jgi:hypothetical protein
MFSEQQAIRREILAAFVNEAILQVPGLGIGQATQPPDFAVLH